MDIEVPMVTPAVIVFGIFFIITLFCREKATVFWYFFCGWIQLAMEYNYGINHRLIRTARTSAFTDYLLEPTKLGASLNPEWWARIYEQYSKYDTRYVRSDPTIVALSQGELPQGIACFLLILLIQIRSPWRHPLQILTAAVQFWGTYIYFYVPYLNGTWAKDFPASQQEFWTYVVGLNGVWFVIPLILAVQSLYALVSLQQQQPRTRPVTADKKTK